MKNVASQEGAKSDNQLLAEIDRLSAEIRVMLDDSLRKTEEAKNIGRRNGVLLAELERRAEAMQRD